jgi:hypothetical protein
MLELLISIQNVYAPFGRSSAKNFQLIRNSFDEDAWDKEKRDFDPRRELELLDLDIKDVVYYYYLFSDKAVNSLGGESPRLDTIMEKY